VGGKKCWLSLAIIIIHIGSAGQVVAALECSELVATSEPFESAGYSRGMLWRIESVDGQINHLFGTIHLTDPRVTDLPYPVVKALNDSVSFGMEVVLDIDAIGTMSKAMYLADGKSLVKILEPALFAATIRLLDRYGVPAEAAQKLKPWAAFTTVSLPPGQSGVPLDMFLMFAAQQDRKSIFGLETIDEQLAVFNTLAMSDQVELLNQVVCHYDEFQADVETMIEHYLARDLAAIMQMAVRYRTPLQERVLEVLLWQRNRRMAARMLPHLHKGGAFIAIGALHLPGIGGVLDILSKHGYTIEPIH
jgi:uncharacterized protein YbaP (TraB family)